MSFSEAGHGHRQPDARAEHRRVATYVSGSGSVNLTFDYTVQAGDNASPLAYNGTGSLALAGGTIRDAATNDAALTLAAPGTGGSLDANTTITIDTTAPTVSGVSASNADGAYKAGDVIHVQVAFGEPVTVTGTPTLSLTSGGSASYVSGSGSSTLTLDYTVQPGDTATRLDASSTSALGGGTIRDGAGNDATLTVAVGQGTAGALANAKNLRIDTTEPDGDDHLARVERHDIQLVEPAREHHRIVGRHRRFGSRRSRGRDPGRQRQLLERHDLRLGLDRLRPRRRHDRRVDVLDLDAPEPARRRPHVHDHGSRDGQRRQPVDDDARRSPSTSRLRQ